MISLIILSHSKKIVEGIKELAYQMVKDTNIYAIGGSSDGTIGSDYNAMNDAVIDALSKGEVLVLFDLGSTVMTMQMVIDELDESEKEKIKIVDAALVEGSIQAAVDIEIGKDFSEIIKNLESLKLGKIQ